MPSLRHQAPPSAAIQPIDDAAALLDRADELRIISAKMRNPEARRMMLALADTYKHLAERAYKRAKRK